MHSNGDKCLTIFSYRQIIIKTITLLFILTNFLKWISIGFIVTYVHFNELPNINRASNATQIQYAQRCRPPEYTVHRRSHDALTTALVSPSNIHTTTLDHYTSSPIEFPEITTLPNPNPSSPLCLLFESRPSQKKVDPHALI